VDQVLQAFHLTPKRKENTKGSEYISFSKNIENNIEVMIQKYVALLFILLE
jgi:hypothetical protein